MLRVSCVMLLMVVLSAAGLTAAAWDPPADPFPIRRVRVAADQLPDALKQLDAGPVVQLPRADFEDRVLKASKAIAIQAPRLTRADYTASLTADEDLVGMGAWELTNTAPRAAAFPLDSFRLALRSAVWADGRDAIIGVLGPGPAVSPSLWLERPGRHQLSFAWSLAGSAGPGERRFELRVPPCPSATLDLTLPANRTPFITTGGFLFGPMESPGRPDAHMWRVRFGDQSKLEFAVRAASGSATFNGSRATLVAKYEVSLGQVSCTFEYNIAPSHGAVSEWVFGVDPELLITDAVVFNRSGWRIEGPPADRRLLVNLRQPGSGGKVVVTGTAPFHSGQLPMVRPRNGIVGEERIELHLQSDVKLFGWNPTDYRVIDHTGTPDQGRALTFVGTLNESERESRFRRPPAIQVGASTSEFATREGVEWRVESGREVLVVRLGIRVRRGSLFDVQIQTPPGFEQVRVTAGSDDLIASVGDTTTPHGLVIEFAKPLRAGQQADVRIELRGPPLARATGKPTRLPLPRVSPVGASEREGWLSLSAVPGWVIAPDFISGPLSAADPLQSDPALPGDRVSAFSYHGREPEGWIALAPVRAQFESDTLTRIRSEGEKTVVTTRFDLKVLAGAVSSLAVFEEGETGVGRTWSIPDGSNHVTASSFDVGALSGMLSIGLGIDMRSSLPVQRGKLWLVRFAQPVTRSIVLESTVEFPGPPLGSTPDSDLKLLPQFLLLGSEIAARRVELGPSLARDFKSEIDDGRIVLHPRSESKPVSTPTASNLRVTTTVRQNEIQSVLAGDLSGELGSTLNVQLPPGSELRFATIDGASCLEPTRNGTTIRLTVSSHKSIPFEVHYRSPGPNRCDFSRVDCRLPELSGATGGIEHRWRFAEDVLPLIPFDGSLESVVLVSRRDATFSSFSVAGVLLAIGMVITRRWAGFAGVMGLAVGIVVGLGLLTQSEEWQPVLAPVLAAAVIVFCLATSRRGRFPQAAAAAAIVIGCTVSMHPSGAQPLAPDTVLLLPGPADDPDAEISIVPRTLLAKLDAAARITEPPYAITTAAYQGQVDANVVRVTARLTVHAFHDETTVQLPFADVRLEGGTVDDAPAFPIAVRPDLYSVAIAGRGRHTIELRFVVPVTSVGLEREIRFGTPEVPASSIRMELPENAEFIQVVGRFGAQHLQRRDGKTALTTDLGTGRNITLRWRMPGGATPAIQYRQACIWDVSESEIELNAGYLLRIDKGAVSQLRLDLPAEVELSRVAVRNADAIGPVAGFVRDWRLGQETAGFRPLFIDLVAPVEGRVLVILEGVPNRTPMRRPLLRFPRFSNPGAIAVPGGSFLAMRPNRVEIEDLNRAGVIDLTPDELLLQFGAVADLKLDQVTPGFVVFRPTSPTANPELRPALRPERERVVGSTETTWLVGPGRTDIEGTVRWLGGQPLTTAEFEFPAIALFGATLPRITVTEVRGAEVAGWGQHRGRIQVWFRKPVKDPSIEWIGHPLLAASRSTNSIQLQALTPRPLFVRQLTQVVKIRPDRDSVVRIERDTGWKSVVAVAGREWSFTSDEPCVPVAFRLFPPAPLPTPRGFGLLDVAAATATYRCALEMTLLGGGPRRFALVVDGLPAQATVEIDGPPGVIFGPPRTERTEQRWSFEVPPETKSVRVAVVIRFPMPDRTIRLPVVSVDAVEGVGDPDGAIRWVGVTGNRPEIELRVARRASIAEILDMWPGEADRLRRASGSLWSVSAGSGSPILVVTSSSRPQASPPVKFEGQPPLDRAPMEPDTVRIPWTEILWCLASTALIALFFFLPRWTWPEQIGLAVGLFSALIAPWWLGLIAYAVLRLWTVATARKPSGSNGGVVKTAV